jgi:TRAP-type C4-dicarboxylate transport system permease small subunit
MRRWAEVAALTVASVFALYFAFWMGNLAYESWAFGDRGQGLLPWPLWIPQSGPALGAAVLAMALLDELANRADRRHADLPARRGGPPRPRRLLPPKSDRAIRGPPA